MVSIISDIKSQLNEKIRDENSLWSTIFTYMEKRFGTERETILWNGMLICAVWMAFGFAGQLLCNLICASVAAIRSIEAIELGEAGEDSVCLYTYWVIYGALTITEYCASFLIQMVPFYWFFKCAFLLYLLLPSPYNGANRIFRQFIEPNMHGPYTCTYWPKT